MLIKLNGSDLAPVAARAVVDARFSSELGLGTPAGASGTTDRGTAEDAAPVESAHELWMRDRLIEAERSGHVVKLTGPRSVSSPGGDAA